MDEPIQKMEKDCSAIVDAQFPEIEAHAKVWLIVVVVCAMAVCIGLFAGHTRLFFARNL